MYDIKAAIDAWDPRLFYVFMAGVVFVVIYLWRQLLPATFDNVPKRFQFVPALMLGAVLSASADSESVKTAVVSALVGALSSGLAAVGGHHALKQAPGPYGAKKKVESQ